MKSTGKMISNPFSFILASRTRIIIAAACVAILGGSFAAGGIAAVAVLKWDKVKARLGIVDRPEPRPDVISAGWKKIETAILTLEKRTLPLGDVNGSATGGSIVSFGDQVIYVSATGHIATIDVNGGEIVYHETRLPMNYDTAFDEYIANYPQFPQHNFRTLDSHLHKTSDTAGDLYVSHHVFEEEKLAFCHVISRRPIELKNGEVNFPEAEWEEIYRLAECVDMNDTDWEYPGIMSGGRIVAYDDDHILTTVGTYAAGVDLELGWKDRLDPESDSHLGRVLKLNLKTGDVSIVASGMRNPQGLTIDSQGRIWTTEHGPQGGDEVNLVKPGRDYGWPVVTYGAGYGAPRTHWPTNPVQGRHDGFEKPKYAFLPSVGVSNLVSIPGDKAFSAWRNDLLVSSLRGNSVYRMRVENDHIRFAEPIPFDERLRDIILMDNGRLAILSAAPNLIVVRDPNAPSETDAPDAGVIEVAGYDGIKPVEAISAQRNANYPFGQLVFGNECGSCHRLDGEIEVAPPLNGVIGRKVGGYPDYGYTEGLSDSDKKWSADLLRRYLENPQQTFPGTAMPNVKLNDWERRELIDYIGGTEAN